MLACELALLHTKYTGKDDRTTINRDPTLFLDSVARRTHSSSDLQILARPLGGIPGGNEILHDRNRIRPRAKYSFGGFYCDPADRYERFLGDCRASRRSSSPTTGSGFSFVPVGRWGPRQYNPPK